MPVIKKNSNHNRKEKADKSCALVFPTAGCNPKLDFLDSLKTVAERAKFDKENSWLHKFRATFATWSLWASVDLRTLQQWLGHPDMENVAILDDGGNLKAFSRMDGAPIPTIEMALNKAYTALFGVSTQDFFNFIQSDPSLLAGIPTVARMAAWGGGFPIKVNGELVGAVGVSGAPTVQNDVDCATPALALVSDASLLR
jgi:uncharacterized protein GlcG (DUF336 family)